MNSERKERRIQKNEMVSQKENESSKELDVFRRIGNIFYPHQKNCFGSDAQSMFSRMTPDLVLELK
jgi:hypothetical protein